MLSDRLQDVAWGACPSAHFWGMIGGILEGGGRAGGGGFGGPLPNPPPPFQPSTVKFSFARKSWQTLMYTIHSTHQAPFTCPRQRCVDHRGGQQLKTQANLSVSSNTKPIHGAHQAWRCSWRLSEQWHEENRGVKPANITWWPRLQ